MNKFKKSWNDYWPKKKEKKETKEASLPINVEEDSLSYSDKCADRYWKTTSSYTISGGSTWTNYNVPFGVSVTFWGNINYPYKNRRRKIPHEEI